MEENRSKKVLKKYVKTTYAVYLRYEVIKVQKFVNLDKHYPVYRFILPSVNSHCNFQIFFHVPCIIISNVYFHTVLFMFPFLQNRSQSKAGLVNQMIQPGFCKS